MFACWVVSGAWQFTHHACGRALYSRWKIPFVHASACRLCDHSSTIAAWHVAQPRASSSS